MRQAMICLAVYLAAPLSASASSDDAWADFADKVRTECLEAADPLLERAVAAVDPFGSESFGLAVLTGMAKGGNVTVSYICVMNKQSGSVELGSELPSDLLTITIP